MAGWLSIRAAVLLVAGAIGAYGQQGGTVADSARAERSSKEPKEELRVTTHRVRIAGEEIVYRATAGTLLLKEEDGKPKASIFFIAYEKQGVTDPRTRPLTFSFNGGPGSSSVWLHLGLLGPRRVLLDDEGNPPPPPYRLVNNEYSLLDVTDLVFIDPVTTGYSRAVPGEDPRQFHGVDEDVVWVGEFIRLYTTRFMRWASPKFLIGESYGTTRAAALAGHLQERHGMYLNGIMLISAILNFQTANFAVGNDLPYILFLPSYTATAWYHRRLPPELQSDLVVALRRAEGFAMGTYATALMKGDALTEAETGAVADSVAMLTGLSEVYVRQSNLRIAMARFVKELLRLERRTVGRLDSRFKGIDRDAAGERYEFDPSYAAIQGPFTATLNDYVRRELKFESDLPYEILTGRVSPWNYAPYQNRYLNVAETLRKAMSMNPYLRVFVACGLYDLATPYFAAKYTVEHMELDPSLRGNITVRCYEAGHMMYIHKPSLVALKEDLASFVRNAIQQ
ncbi:MAG: peptidase S10 [candidate division KSB1 bacterium]|nr:peptidase S10 [candidate division KSB1 bacterium]